MVELLLSVRLNHGAPSMLAWKRKLPGCCAIAGGLILAAIRAHANGVIPDLQTVPKPIVRDSAGVQIVVYESLRSAPRAFVVEAIPFRDFGGVQWAGGAELDELTPLSSATELSGGGIVVNELSRLTFFDRNGRFVRRAGRRGSGPGEFQQTREVCRLVGDTLLVMDYSDGRLSLWDSAGRHIRTFSRPGLVPARACAENGTLVAYVGDRDKFSSDGTGLLYRLIRPDGTLVRELGRLPSDLLRLPLHFEAAIVLTSDGLVVGDAKSLELRFQSFDGRLRRILRVAELPPSVSDKVWDSLANATIPRNVSATQRRDRLSHMNRLPRPARFPAFSSVRMDGRGRLWVGDYSNRRKWTVFDAMGTLLGTVELPWPASRYTELAGLGRDHMVVRRIDADGAMHLSFHRLLSAR